MAQWDPLTATSDLFWTGVGGLPNVRAARLLGKPAGKHWLNDLDNFKGGDAWHNKNWTAEEIAGRWAGRLWIANKGSFKTELNCECNQ